MLLVVDVWSGPAHAGPSGPSCPPCGLQLTHFTPFHPCNLGQISRVLPKGHLPQAACQGPPLCSSGALGLAPHPAGRCSGQSPTGGEAGVWSPQAPRTAERLPQGEPGFMRRRVRRLHAQWARSLGPHPRPGCMGLAEGRPPRARTGQPALSSGLVALLLNPRVRTAAGAQAGGQALGHQATGTCKAPLKPAPPPASLPVHAPSGPYFNSRVLGPGATRHPSRPPPRQGWGAGLARRGRCPPKGPTLPALVHITCSFKCYC